MISHSLKNLAIVGAGNIGMEYSRILTDFGIMHTIISRSSAHNAHNVLKCDLYELPLSHLQKFDGFIVAVQAEYTGDILAYLLDKTSSAILVEKPISLSPFEHRNFATHFSRIFVALNRRKFSSTKYVLDNTDLGSVTRCMVEVTEIRNRMKGTSKTLEAWPIANTLHIIDLALYAAGTYNLLEKGVEIVCGHGGLRACVSLQNCDHSIIFLDFTGLPGNWGIDLLKQDQRFIMRPLETLETQKINDVKRIPVPLENSKYKPGFEQNTIDFIGLKRESFISYEEYDFLMSLIVKIYNL